MKFPLRSTVQIGRYVASQKKNDRYPLVIMLEPTLGCNIACIGCGKIREYESNKARLTVEECLQAAVECPAPVISVCGGEPLIFKGIEDVVGGFLEMKRNIQLCTNALRLSDMLDRFEPNPRLTFVVHLDGMQEIHDYICDYPGLWEIAVAAIREAREAGFRVTTNTTTFKETDVNDVLEMMRFLTEEVGIDGMLVAPGYQYSQIDPALTMTRAEHEEKFRTIRDGVRKNGYKWLASPVYQDFLTGDRKLPCAPWGSVTRNPYGWKGPCYLLTDGIFPTYEALIDGIEWERYGPGNDHRCEHCGIHSGFEPSATIATTSSVKETVRSLAWTLPADSGLRAEESRRRRPGRRVRALRLSVSAPAFRFPKGRSSRSASRAVSAKRFVPARSSTATRVVDPFGRTLWDGPALEVAGAEPAVIVASDGVANEPEARRALAEQSGAAVVDMESGVLASTGRLAGVVRAISDSGDQPVGRLVCAGKADGGTDWKVVATAFVTEPVRSIRTDAPRSQGERRVDARGRGAVMSKRVLVAAPRSFCAGVVRAIDIVEKLLEQHGPPVYVRHEIVHNVHVVRDLEARGAVFVESEDEVPEGESDRPLGARRLARVYEKCAARGLEVVDATFARSSPRCTPRRGAMPAAVSRSRWSATPATSRSRARWGRRRSPIVLVETPEDARASTSRTASRSPTSRRPRSPWTTRPTSSTRCGSVSRISSGRRRADICYATQNRQDAVKRIVRGGDARARRRLAHELERQPPGGGRARPRRRAYLIDDETRPRPAWLDGHETVGLTAGASSPELLVDRVFERLADSGSTSAPRSSSPARTLFSACRRIFAPNSA